MVQEDILFFIKRGSSALLDMTVAAKLLIF